MENAKGCGFPERQIKLYKNFITFVEELSKESGLPEDLIYDNLSANAVKRVLPFKKGEPPRVSVEKHIVSTLKSKHSPTRKTIEDAMGIAPEPKRISNPTAIKKSVTSSFSLEINSTNDAKQKNKIFLSILTAGQIQIWSDWASNNDCEDEYSALCKVTANLFARE